MSLNFSNLFPIYTLRIIVPSSQFIDVKGMIAMIEAAIYGALIMGCVLFKAHSVDGLV